MKNPFKKFQSSSKGNRVNEHKPFSLSGWFNSVKNRNRDAPETSSDLSGEEGLEISDSSNLKDPSLEEEYQLKLALELSAKEDPEAAEIEAVKQISLGSYPHENTPAKVVAYRYWNYNALSYDEKILDGFYDLHGVTSGHTLSKMPSLVDLQGAQLSDDVTWEVILVNRADDANLLLLEQKALEMAVKLRSKALENSVGSDIMTRNLAILVVDYMGGAVEDPDNISKAWKRLAYSLRATIGSMVLPLGSLTIGLARHRALLFKVLADGLGIPCRLVKGKRYTGSNDAAMNFVKLDDGREYIIDLMADPGTLIPSDAVESHVEICEEPLFSSSPLSRDMDLSHVASSSSGVTSSFDESSEPGTTERRFKSKNREGREPSDVGNDLVREILSGPDLPVMHGRSPLRTNGVEDVSQCMIDAAKENPQLAQKKHDVLLESGVVPPPNPFDEISQDNLDVLIAASESLIESEGGNKKENIIECAEVLFLLCTTSPILYNPVEEIGVC